MRKLTAVTVAVGLISLGQPAIAGPRGHAARPHVVTITVQGPPTHQNVEHLDQLMSGLSKIPTRAAEAKADHSPGEFAAKAAPIVEQSPRYQNAHASSPTIPQGATPAIPQGATEAAKNLQSKALAAEGALQSKQADLQAEKASVAE